eukprot:s2362_g13.t1
MLSIQKVHASSSCYARHKFGVKNALALSPAAEARTRRSSASRAESHHEFGLHGPEPTNNKGLSQVCAAFLAPL